MCARFIPCGECLVDRHSLCPDASVADSFDADEGMVDDDMYCCCGHAWTARRLSLSAEYAQYAEEARRRYGTDPNAPAYLALGKHGAEQDGPQAKDGEG